MERIYDKLKRCSPYINLRNNNIKFIPYASDKKLKVIGKVKLVLKIMNKKIVKWIAYVAKGEKSFY